MLSPPDRKYAPWRFVYLVLIWAFELAVLPVTVIILALLVVFYSPPTTTTYIDSAGHIQTLTPGVPLWVTLNLVVLAIDLILTCMEIVLLNMRDLSPQIYLWFSIVKTVTILGPIGLNAYTFSTIWSLNKYNNIFNGVVVGFNAFLFVIFAISLVHAIVMVRRYRRQAEDYLERHVSDHFTMHQPLNSTQYR
ncbi:hypothetical protein G7Y89_g8323 [Cudoniella acicularis]|uniref:Transmembrane protein n=1 Tax=Cudoniella acicularis TaxID=354080 RepID=A0A8H4RID0_9HELO|nr:hypothetical protein G7Y89_g8323 [Cudoniella acicularis]